MGLKYRLDKLMKIMDEKELDAILITRPDNIQYYLGIKTIADSVLILHVSTKENPTVYVPVLEYYRFRDTIGKYVDVKAFSKTMKLIDGVVIEKKVEEIVSEVASKYNKIGTDLRGSPIAITIKEALKEKAIDIMKYIVEQRSIKEDDEIKSIQKAIDATIKGIKMAIDSMHKDITEASLAGIFEYRVRIEGNEEQAFPPLVLFKPGNSYPHNLPSTKKLGRRNLVLIDVGIKINGYCSDLTRTIPWGNIKREEYKVIEAVNEAIENVIDKAEPYMTGDEIDRIARKTLAKYGYDKYFIHGLGHGLGINVHEPPYLTIKYEKKIVPGMVFTIEPGVYIPGKFGVRIEENALMTEKGIKILSSKLPRILYP